MSDAPKIQVHLPAEVMVGYSASVPAELSDRLLALCPDASEIPLPAGVSYCLRLGRLVHEIAPLMVAGGDGLVLLRSADPTLMLIGPPPDEDQSPVGSVSGSPEGPVA